MWSEKDNFDMLKNINVKSKYKNDVFMYFQLFPAKGFVLRIPEFDMFLMSEETGEPVVDENGNKIIDVPYRTLGMATEQGNYNFSENPKGYMAEKYTEDMSIF